MEETYQSDTLDWSSLVIFLFLFFSTAVFLSGFLRHFSTDLDQIWHTDSPWRGDLYVLIASQ